MSTNNNRQLSNAKLKLTNETILLALATIVALFSLASLNGCVAEDDFKPARYANEDTWTAPAPLSQRAKLTVYWQFEDGSECGAFLETTLFDIDIVSEEGSVSPYRVPCSDGFRTVVVEKDALLYTTVTAVSEDSTHAVRAYSGEYSGTLYGESPRITIVLGGAQ